MADSKKVKLLYILGFMDVLSFSLLMPLLFDHFISLELSQVTIGILGSLHSGLQLISSPIIGSWSDIRGHSAILQITLIISAICYFVLGSTVIFPIILLTRIVHGLCEHTQSLFGTLLAEAAMPNKQSEVQGQMAAIAGLGFMVGPVIGGHLAEKDSGFQLACYIVSLVLMINFAIVRYFLTTTSTSKNQKRKKNMLDKIKQNQPEKKPINNDEISFSSEIFRAITDLKNINWPLYWDIFTIKLFSDFTLGLHIQNFRIVLKDVYNITPSWIGYSMASIGLIGAVTGFLNGRLSDLYKNDKNHAHKAFHSCAGYALAFLLISIAPNFPFLMIGLFLQSASGSLLGITINEIILSRTAPEKRGSILGTAQSIFSLSFLLSPVTAGVIYELYGHNGVAVVKVITATATLMFSLFLFQLNVKTKKK